MENKEINNQLLEGISILIKDSLAKADFTKVIEALIVQVLDVKVGKYQVRYQDSLLEAYSNNLNITYKSGTRVKVLVQNNDLSAEKVILGTTETAGLSNTPLTENQKRFIPIGENCVSPDVTFDLSSYRQGKHEKVVYSDADNINLIGLSVGYVNENIVGASHVMFGAEFSTTIPAENQSTGNYGFQIIYEGLSKTHVPYQSEFFVDVNDMIGNPYVLVEPTFQHEILAVTGLTITKIKKIVLFVYGFPVTKDDSLITESDIFIRNIRFMKVAVESDIFNNQLGGRNFGVNTGLVANTRGVTTRGDNLDMYLDKDEVYNSNNSLRIVATNTCMLGLRDIWWYMYNPLVVGTPLSINFFVKGSSDSLGWLKVSSATTSAQMMKFQIKKDWTRVKLDLGMTYSSGTRNDIKIIFGFDLIGTYWINSMMIESAENKFSDWLPAPEDNMALFSYANQIPAPESEEGIATASGTNFLHVAFSNSSDGVQDFSVNDSFNRTFIGAYLDNIKTSSLDPTKYNWTKLDNINYEMGIPTAPDVNGIVTYLHVAYADSPSGQVGFDTSDGLNKRYIGTYVDTSIIDSKSASDYTWKLIPGATGMNGQDAYKVDIISTNGLIFKNDDIQTMLIARVYKGAVDVTDSIDASRFKWTKVDADGVLDDAWNTSHAGGTKDITVTGADVFKRATFTCEIMEE